MFVAHGKSLTFDSCSNLIPYVAIHGINTRMLLEEKKKSFAKKDKAHA